MTSDPITERGSILLAAQVVFHVNLGATRNVAAVRMMLLNVAECICHSQTWFSILVARQLGEAEQKGPKL
jgi:hypothetical protein